MPAKRRSEQPTKAEKQAMHAALAARFNIPLGKVRQLIDDSDTRLTRADIEQALLAYCLSLSKG